MNKLVGVAVVLVLIIAAGFFYMSFHRTAQFNSEMQDINQNLRQIADHLDRIATSLEEAQLLRPAPSARQPGG